jgi:hypothetical protein
MKHPLTWAAGMIIGFGLLGSYGAYAQTGNATALPPGGANTTAPARSSGTTQPARSAGTTQPARSPSTTQPASGTGTTTATRGTAPPAAAAQIGQGFDAGPNLPRFGDRFSTPQGFGGNSGVFNRAPATGAGTPIPGSPLPGGPNFSRGSTSATLRPAGPIAGGPNAGDGAFNQDNAQLNVPLTGNPQIDAVVNGFRRPFSTPRVSGVPAISVVPQVPVPAPPVTPATPQATIAPALPLAVEAQGSVRTGIDAGTQETVVEPLVEPQEVATATAFPTRERMSRERGSVAASSRTTFRTAPSDVVEVPTGRGLPRTTAFRGNMGEPARRGDVRFVEPVYVLWQGYYWYHSPTSGWRYWDGSRWIRF